MTKRNKLIDRFKSEPNDFTFDELVTLLGYFGYYCDNKGKPADQEFVLENKDMK